MTYSIGDLNQASEEDFVNILGAVFEDSPEIARQVWQLRPFRDRHHLQQCMTQIVKDMSEAQQIALIRAHPDLGSKAKMADASVQEQAGVGFDRLLPAEYELFLRLNQQYKATFGFPFVIAVKNHTKSSILNAFESRLSNTVETERKQAIAEIIQIAHLRLQNLIPN